VKNETLIDAGEVARMLGISRRTLEDMRHENRGPAYLKISRKCVRYSRADLEKFLSRMRVDPEEDPR
jgi:excisionase family DNA binding protein